MSSNCTLCGSACIFKRRPNAKEGELFGAQCDGCELFICKDCAKLTATEVDAVVLQNRTLSFCYDCRAGFPDIVQLAKKFEQLQVELTKKDKYIFNLEADLEDLKLTLKDEIQRLSDDNKLKNDHIERLERRTQTLDEEVFEAERNYEAIIQSQKIELNRISKDLADQVRLYELNAGSKNLIHKESQTSNILLQHKCIQATEAESGQIETLNRKLEHLESTNIKLQSELDTSITKFEELQMFFNEMNSMSRNMTSTIETLSAENDMYANEVKKLQNDIFKLNNSHNPGSRLHNHIGKELATLVSNGADKLGNESNSSKINRTNKILILCDDRFRFMLNSVGAKFNNYNVQSIIKPNACFKDVISDVLSLTKNFTLKDYVILHAGYHDVQNGRAPFFRFINGLLKHCTHTKIIFTTVSYSYKKNTNIQLMYKLNSQLFNYANALNRYAEGTVVCIDLNDANGLVHKKNAIVDKLLCSTQHKVKNGNLVFIRPWESLPVDQVAINDTNHFLDNPPQSQIIL